jgi:hypothetical protein
MSCPNCYRPNCNCACVRTDRVGHYRTDCDCPAPRAAENNLNWRRVSDEEFMAYLATLKRKYTK